MKITMITIEKILLEGVWLVIIGELHVIVNNNEDNDDDLMMVELREMIPFFNQQTATRKSK